MSARAEIPEPLLVQVAHRHSFGRQPDGCLRAGPVQDIDDALRVDGQVYGVSESTPSSGQEADGVAVCKSLGGGHLRLDKIFGRLSETVFEFVILRR